MRASSSCLTARATVVFSTSHISAVIVPRTARAFSRAALAHEQMLDGLSPVERHEVQHVAAALTSL